MTDARPPEPVIDYAQRPAAGPVAQDASIPLRQLAAVACKLMAVWLMAGVAASVITGVWQVVNAVSYLASTRRSAPDLIPIALAGLTVVGPIVAGVALWRLADRIAWRIAPVDAAVPTGIGQQGLLSIGLAMAGVVVGASAARDGVALVAYMVLEHPTGDWLHNGSFVHQLASALTGLGLAVWLVLGGRGIARVVVMARTAGHPAVAPPAEQRR